MFSLLVSSYIPFPIHLSFVYLLACLGVLDTHGHITVFGCVGLIRLFTEAQGRYPGHDFGAVAGFVFFAGYISGIRSPLDGKVD